MRPRYIIALSAAALLAGGCAQLRPGGGSASAPRPPAEESAIPAGDRDPSIVVNHERGGQDLWARLRAGMALDRQAEQKIVHRRIQWYERNVEFLGRTLERGRPYLHYILTQVEKRGMPVEIALLPLVESAYQPYALSPKSALGLWQFIPRTGKRYGLNSDWWQEDRRDVVAATSAALDYLQELHEEFDGDWLLALAAYNAGEKAVGRALAANRKKGKPLDFWSLRVPRETRHYVPSLLAVCEIVTSPARYGLNLPPLPDRPYFEIVALDGPVDLAVAAELAEIDLEDLYALNPGPKRWQTSPHGPHRLLLPIDKATAFRTRLSHLSENKRTHWIDHQVRPGESLLQIATRYGMDSKELGRLNRLSSTKLDKGVELRVPAPRYPAKRYSSRYRRASGGDLRLVGTSGRQKTIHTVRKGDSLWTIARRYGVSVKRLRGWNGKTRGNLLHPGQKLVVWQTPAVATASGDPYLVRKGDSLWSIARRFDSSITQLAKLNGLRPKQTLYPGQKLWIAAKRASFDRPVSQSIRYVVRRGDSLWSIAKRFGTSIKALQSSNRLQERQMLYPGQSLIVPL